MWKLYAIFSALFAAAAAVAILAKIGLTGVNSNLAKTIRTVIILVVSWSIVLVSCTHTGIKTLSKQNLLFIVLSGIATGISWLFYFKALQIGPASKVANSL